MTQTDHAPSTGVRRGLGRGLGSLIPTLPSAAPAGPAGPPASDDTATRPGPVSAPPVVDDVTPSRDLGAWFADVPVDAIVPNPRQPRQVFDEEAMAELVHSVREVGLLQPVVVRPTGPGSYELVMGERRWRACQQVGMATVPAIVRHTQDDAMLRDGLLENLHRAQLNPLEEAAAYQQLLEDFGCTHEELAARIGRSRPQITNTLRLLKLSPAVQRRVAAGVISAGHARTLLAVPDAAAQDQLATRVVAEGISVRSLEELVTLGADGSPARPGRERRPSPAGGEAAAEAAVWAERLGDHLDTRVRIDVGRSRSRITVDCADADDLRRVLARIDGSLVTE
ncbi:MAG: Chromosome (plasmid) partitioning protein ParB [uncultured Nocardioidaceae bacterium]|uniref:Chromosome (Plasmid) partitioning protein ParB n=1 Tax=uncultured Nocardioidaceae bacterium TaxID=253824 RepID=A0A6J4M8Y7_9ACTN|nr:MAG: Chromosome (plasmid) partitioning protein ParB [uncultured Nocardioidaceae bacterium]